MAGHMMPQPPQMMCRGCHTILSYPFGATSVRCPVCENVTAVCQIRINCITCRTPLMLPINTTLALCPCCTSVMQVPRQMLPVPPGAGQGRRPTKTVVYVENPPTMEQGRLVSSMSLPQTQKNQLMKEKVDKILKSIESISL